MVCWAKLWSWWQVTAYITQELRESVRFLERIYTYDELRLHLMILGQIASVQKFISYDFAKIGNLSKSISLQTAYIRRIFSTRKPLLSFESYQRKGHIQMAVFRLNLFRGSQTQNAGFHRDMVAKIDFGMPYEIQTNPTEKHGSIAVRYCCAEKYSPFSRHEDFIVQPQDWTRATGLAKICWHLEWQVSRKLPWPVWGWGTTSETSESFDAKLHRNMETYVLLAWPVLVWKSIKFGLSSERMTWTLMIFLYSSTENKQ